MIHFTAARRRRAVVSGLVLAVVLPLSAAADNDWGELSSGDCANDVIGATREHHSILWNYTGGSAFEVCLATAASVPGKGAIKPTSCVWRGAYLWGSFRVPDATCPAVYENLASLISNDSTDKQFADRNAGGTPDTLVQTLTFQFDPAGADDAAIFSFADVSNITLADDVWTFVLIHGFGSTPAMGFGEYPGKSLLAAVRTKNPDANVLVVDWSSLSRVQGDRWDSYNYVYNRMWFVGWRLADALADIGIDPARTELIGYSLGAHIAGTAGKRYADDNDGMKIARIVGLDAAGLYMTQLGEDVRLTKDDADRVVGIHGSDARFFDVNVSKDAVGWYDPYGHLDLYILTGEFSTKPELLGSGNGWWRNRHDYPVTLYTALVWGESLKAANSWSWEYAAKFTSGFALGDVRDKSGTWTLAYTRIK